MDNIVLLKRTIANRESTITFLNEILDGQSKAIGNLKDEVESLESENRELREKFETLQNKNDNLISETKYYREVLRKVLNENDVLKHKLSVLFNAFESVKEPNEEKKGIPTELDGKSDLKEQYEKDLKSQQWKNKREEVFERYGHQCSECGKTKNLQVHHLVYHRNYKHPWEYDVTEMIPLCRSCHRKVSEDKTHPLHEKYVD